MGRRDSNSKGDAETNSAPARQRLDLWLWHARIVRTRTLAAELAESGHVRINGARAKAAGKFLKVGDVLTIALKQDARILRVLEFAERRGAYLQAQLLYQDLASPKVTQANQGGK